MMLWGNTRSGLLFCPGNRYYGVTKRGVLVDSSNVGSKVPGARTKVWKISARSGGCI